jgi:hypothetical protein
LPREAEVVEQMPVIGDIVQRGALPAMFAPTQPFVQQRSPSRP